MRAVLQRVREASVRVPAPGAERLVASIGPGLVVLVGFSGSEAAADLDWMAEKILALRLFPRETARAAAGGERVEFDRSVIEVAGEVLVVSQFTLLASVRKGRRPDFVAAAPAERALPLYEEFVRLLTKGYGRVQEGLFGAEMLVALVNDGPVTLVLER